MFFASDNAGPAHPAVIEALARANDGYAMAYGGDRLTAAVTERLRDIFEAPEAAVFLVGTGTAANALALATLSEPWQTVFCTPVAHVQEDECNAPEFFTGGAKLTLVGEGDKMTPEALAASIAREETRGVHGPQRGPVTLTQATERGGVYHLDELAALCAVAGDYGLPVHMDGARFANALVALGCSPAEMTWKAGVDAISLGGTKNGCLGVEAVILFDPARAREFELRRKRGAHLFSKHRFLAAQMQAWLEDGLWLELARRANARARQLEAGFRARGVEILGTPEANIVFAAFPRHLHRRLHDAGVVYYLWEAELEGDDEDAPLIGRFVCDWSMEADAIERLLALLPER